MADVYGKLPRWAQISVAVVLALALGISAVWKALPSELTAYLLSGLPSKGQSDRSAAMHEPRELHRTTSKPKPPDGMVYVVAGSFSSGSTSAQALAAYAQCRRELGDGACPKPFFLRETKVAGTRAVHGFYLDRHEATCGDFARWLTSLGDHLSLRRRSAHATDVYMTMLDGRSLRIAQVGALGESGRTSGLILQGDRIAARQGAENHPIVGVTWYGADLYCRDRAARLPSEEEWEYAARGTGARTFPWGERAPRCDGVIYGRDSGGACPTRPRGPAIVGGAEQDRTPDSRIMDLGGNVAEWVSTRYVASDDPLCADGTVCRVAKGGSFSDPVWLLRAATRSRSPEDSAWDNVGMRCARDLAESP